jgi:aquaporin TIP
MVYSAGPVQHPGEEKAVQAAAARRYVVEFIGPFALTVLGVGAIIVTRGEDLVAIALAHGLAIGVMVAAAGHISGGVYNPAISVGLALGRRLPWPTALGYILVQCLGALAATIVLKIIAPPDLASAAGVNLGVVAPGPGVSAIQALITEVVLTFFLQFVIYGVAIDKRGPAAIAGLAIGITISVDILGGGPISGAAMNPARALGPAVVQGAFRDLWIYIVGPIIGAAIAAVLYEYFLLPQEQRE